MEQAAQQVVQGLSPEAMIGIVGGAFSFMVALIWYFLKVVIPNAEARHAEERKAREVAHEKQEDQQRADFLASIEKVTTTFDGQLTAERASRETTQRETTATQIETVAAMTKMTASLDSNTAAMTRFETLTMKRLTSPSFKASPAGGSSGDS